MPLTSSGSSREGPTQTDGCGSRARSRSASTTGPSEKGTTGGLPSSGSGPQPFPGESSCSSPILLDNTGEYGEYVSGWGYTLEVPVLCDVLGIIDSEILLGHWGDPNDGNQTVVALDVRGADEGFEDPSVRRVVATAESPQRATFATDLIGDALDAAGDAS